MVLPACSARLCYQPFRQKDICIDEKAVDLVPRFTLVDVLIQAWEAVPTILTETDAAHLVGKCAGCKRPEEDPLKIHQLGGVRSSLTHDTYENPWNCPLTPLQLETRFGGQIAGN